MVPRKARAKSTVSSSGTRNNAENGFTTPASLTRGMRYSFSEPILAMANAAYVIYMLNIVEMGDGESCDGGYLFFNIKGGMIKHVEKWFQKRSIYKACYVVGRSPRNI